MSTDAAPPTRQPTRQGVLPAWGLACLAFVFAAVLLELFAGQATASAAPAWLVALIPLSWAPWGRGLWWLAVAAAAAGYRVAERRGGIQRNRILAVVTPVPFLAFAIGAAFSQQWAAWH